jgi:hypothetical protein
MIQAMKSGRNPIAAACLALAVGCVAGTAFAAAAVSARGADQPDGLAQPTVLNPFTLQQTTASSSNAEAGTGGAIGGAELLLPSFTRPPGRPLPPPFRPPPRSPFQPGANPFAF